MSEAKRDGVAAPATIAVTASIPTPSIVMRGYFSSYLLWMAQHTSELAGGIEAAHSGQSSFNIEHRGFVLSSILSSAGFLEAMVNELFQDALDGHGLSGDGYLAPLPGEMVQLMAEFWQATDEGSRLRPLDKYSMLLLFAGAPALDRGAKPYQDAALVIRTRNAIAHYLPEDRSSNIQHPLEGLRGKFPENPLMAGSGNAWWPDHALGRGCADWAHRAVKTLSDLACDELGISPNYRRLENSGWFGLTPGSGSVRGQ
jgi:hypothetical protein